MDNSLVLSDSIKNRIFTIRGVQVMLDSDLAEMYGVSVKVLNQAVKRNVERFPPNFIFQLTENEFEILKSQFETTDTYDFLNPQNINKRGSNSLRSQFVTSKGGRTYLPYAFTEQGVAMLSGVLKSDTVVRITLPKSFNFNAFLYFFS